jgi:DNA-binding beta-propeller fold protein YncE
VDFTARVQAYDLDGNYIGPTFTTPDFRNGRPSGLGVTRDGKLIVCDSHYSCIRIYEPDGTEIKKIGGEKGTEPGQYGYVSDTVQDDDGFFYVSEFGINERITKLDADGKFVACWGKSGTGDGEFNRIRALALGPDGLLYVADSCNHRIQVFRKTGELVKTIGSEGTGPGELKYPYDVAFGPNGDLYVVERGNHRVQKFSPAGVSLGVWGGPGRKPGQFADPWALVVDKKGRVHVIDTENHRVQRIKF